jgi:hypothetical protein
MTRERDIERVLDRWFAEGPAVMPDRLFQAAFDRIDHIPQRRLARLEMRFAAMTRNTRLAAAAGVIVAIAVLGAITVNSWSTVGNKPTPSPSTTDTPAPSLAALPANLRYVWVGDHRVVPGIEEAQDGSVLALTGSTALWNRGGHAPILRSTASLVAPDEIRFSLERGMGACGAGDLGSYRVVLNPSLDSMTLTPIGETCAIRQAAFAGDWVRSNCPNRDAWCLGDLEAGTHSSVTFNPFSEPTAWKLNFGALSYTVPDGWTNSEDCLGCYLLAKQGAPESTGIFLFDDVVAHVQGARMCQALNEPGVGRKPADLATWLTTLPGLDATPPTPVTIGGLAGYTLDISVAPAWTRQCPYSNGQPMVSLWSDADPADHDGFDWGIGGDAKMRVFLLDLGDGRTLLVDVEGRKVDYEALLPEAMAVINSFTFNH